MFDIKPNPDKILKEPTPKINPWLVHAEEVLRGDWDKSDDSTARSLIIGLKSQTHPTCKKAMQALLKLHKKKDPNENIPKRRRTA